MVTTKLLALLVTVTSSNLVHAGKAAPIIGQYWPAYNSEIQPLTDFPWDSTDLAYYFVTETTPTGFGLPDGQSEADLAAFAPTAHKHGKKALFSVGGWDGGIYFSDLVASAANRTALAKDLKKFADKYKFDGVDLDWELTTFFPPKYPGSQGIGCNIVRESDAANLLAFLKVLRQVFGKDKILTAAVSATGFVGADGNALSSVAEYAKYLNYANLMTYDLGGNWDATTAPNSPLKTCLADYSATDSVTHWLDAGFPANQILLGIPAYSHSFTTLSSTLAVTEVDGFKSLLYQNKTDQTAQGDHTDILSQDGLTGEGGYRRYWDDCTSTPFLFNNQSLEFISYDDSRSAAAKASYAKSKGLAGVMIFDSTGFNEQVLVAIKKALGIACNNASGSTVGSPKGAKQHGPSHHRRKHHKKSHKHPKRF
ncbi:chitinase, partial [Phenoliferia sp. Uapishka_3]